MFNAFIGYSSEFTGFIAHWPPCTGSQSLLGSHLKFYYQFFFFFFFLRLNGKAAPYLSEPLQPPTPFRAPRSTNQLLSEIPRSSLKDCGDFSVVDPNLKNWLPFYVRKDL